MRRRRFDEEFTNRLEGVEEYTGERLFRLLQGLKKVLAKCVLSDQNFFEMDEIDFGKINMVLTFYK